VYHGEEKVNKVHHDKEESTQHDEEESAHHHEQELRKPYVVSEDIHILLEDWAKKTGFILPSREFFSQLRKEMKKHLSGIFGIDNVDTVSTDELARGIKKLLQKTELPAVSMDRVYHRTNPEIQITRAVDETLNDLGVAPRFGAPPLREQYTAIARKYRGKEIALIDDVLFSGKSLMSTIRSLEAEGIKVPVVIVGIAIGKGIKKVKEETNIEILTVRYYAEVIDEICERDFYPGVPLSGRTVVNMPIDVGVPYLYPFAINQNGESKLEEWASIPKEKQKDFSIFCLEQTIQLWEEIENLSGRIVKCNCLERVPLGLHRSPYYNSRLVDCLKTCLEKLR
jgi:pyrimidine operon attenuation protein/uracil phosphoribosyltransferase